MIKEEEKNQQINTQNINVIWWSFDGNNIPFCIWWDGYNVETSIRIVKTNRDYPDKLSEFEFPTRKFSV